MKRLIAVTVLLCVLPCVAGATAFNLYVQDDFRLTFGTAGQPGSAGGTIRASGHVLDADGDWIADFRISGGNEFGAYQQGNEYWTDYAITDITMGEWNLDDNSWDVTYWSGTGDIMTRVKVGGGLYPAGQYAYSSEWYYHPLDQPGYYQGMGRGEVVGTGFGDAYGVNWEGYDIFYIPWIGTYNWHYNQGMDWQQGNLQGMMTDIPEPSTLILLGLGLTAAGVGVIRRRRKA